MWGNNKTVTAKKGTQRPVGLKNKKNKLYKLTVTVRQTYVELENNNIIPQNRETTQNHRKKKPTFQGDTTLLLQGQKVNTV